MTTTELATITHDETALAQLDRHAVVELLERGKSWLQQALARDEEISQLVTYKAEAAVLRELTVQMELGKDAELAATELVRRAERAVGLAIRRGQERGEIRKPHYTKRRPGHDAADGGIIGPVEAAGVRHSSSVSDMYELADGVTDEQFDAALEEARAEGNLARTHLSRKLGNRVKPPAKRPKALRKTRRFDSRTVVAKTVGAAADVVTPSLLAEVDFGELDTGELEQWISSLATSIRALTSLKAQLSKELTHRG